MRQGGRAARDGERRRRGISDQAIDLPLHVQAKFSSACFNTPTDDRGERHPPRRDAGARTKQRLMEATLTLLAVGARHAARHRPRDEDRRGRVSYHFGSPARAAQDAGAQSRGTAARRRRRRGAPGAGGRSAPRRARVAAPSQPRISLSAGPERTAGIRDRARSGLAGSPRVDDRRRDRAGDVLGARGRLSTARTEPWSAVQEGGDRELGGPAPCRDLHERGLDARAARVQSPGAERGHGSRGGVIGSTHYAAFLSNYVTDANRQYGADPRHAERRRRRRRRHDERVLGRPRLPQTCVFVTHCLQDDNVKPNQFSEWWAGLRRVLWICRGGSHRPVHDPPRTSG